MRGEPASNNERGNRKVPRAAAAANAQAGMRKPAVSSTQTTRAALYGGVVCKNVTTNAGGGGKGGVITTETSNVRNNHRQGKALPGNGNGGAITALSRKRAWVQPQGPVIKGVRNPVR